MDYSQFIFALAVIIIGVVRWFIENRENTANQERRDDRDADSDLPEWTWPGEEQQQTPPAIPSSPPPPPPQRNKTSVEPPKREQRIPPPAPTQGGTLSALQQKIEEAKRRGQQAEAQRLKFKTSKPAKQIKSATHTPHGVQWLLDPQQLRRAVIAREILGPPLALRDDPDSEVR